MQDTLDVLENFVLEVEIVVLDPEESAAGSGNVDRIYTLDDDWTQFIVDLAGARLSDAPDEGRNINRQVELRSIEGHAPPELGNLTNLLDEERAIHVGRGENNLAEVEADHIHLQFYFFERPQQGHVAHAVTSDGRPVDPHHPDAVRFCATGALLRAASDLTGDIARGCELRDAACERLLPELAIPRLTLEELNDTSIGYVTVLQVFDAYLDQG